MTTLRIPGYPCRDGDPTGERAARRWPGSVIDIVEGPELGSSKTGGDDDRILDRVRDELDELAHLADDDGAPYALFGSIVLLHYGLRERIGDVDVFVHPAIWHALATHQQWRMLVPDPADPPILETHADGLKVHAFERWQERDYPAVCAEECRRRAIRVSGWWLTPLELIRQHKVHSLAQPGADRDARQAKHRRDLAVIDTHLKAAACRR